MSDLVSTSLPAFGGDTISGKGIHIFLMANDANSFHISLYHLHSPFNEMRVHVVCLYPMGLDILCIMFSELF